MSPPGKVKKLVYVVDDNPLLGQITAQIIGSDGYETRFFTDPLKAREALRVDRPSPDILVTDFDLGPIVGFDLIETAREHIPGIRCMIVSGTVQPQILANHPTRAEKFLPKPFKADELLACVGELAKD
jgi:CheY-like chemotaxis protein